MIEAARAVKRHWDGILRWFDSKIANGLIEGINSLVQAAKAKARRYCSSRNLKAMPLINQSALLRHAYVLYMFYPELTRWRSAMLSLMRGLTDAAFE